MGNHFQEFGRFLVKHNRVIETLYWAFLICSFGRSMIDPSADLPSNYLKEKIVFALIKFFSTLLVHAPSTKYTGINWTSFISLVNNWVLLSVEHFFICYYLFLFLIKSTFLSCCFFLVFIELLFSALYFLPLLSIKSLLSYDIHVMHLKLFFFILLIVNLVIIFSFFQSFYFSFWFTLVHVWRFVIFIGFIYLNANMLQIILDFNINVWNEILKWVFIVFLMG